MRQRPSMEREGRRASIVRLAGAPNVGTGHGLCVLLRPTLIGQVVNKRPEPLRVRTPATATTLRRGLISTECLYVSSYPVHWSIPPTQGTVPTSFLCPRSPILNPKMQEPRYSSASFTGTSSMRSRSKSSGGFSPWRSRTRTCSAEGYLPLRKKTHNFTPTITKTIRRANRKNASIANMVRRLAQKARRL